MLKVTKTGMLILSLLLTATISLAACGNAGQTTTTTSPTPTTTGPSDLVEVTFFYESENCFCLDLATKWVHDTVNNDYQQQIASGKLVFNSYDTRDPETGPVMEEYNATKFALFVTSFSNGEENTWPVSKIWMYTDSSGTNEELKSKFTGELKKNIDRALGTA